MGPYTLKKSPRAPARGEAPIEARRWAREQRRRRIMATVRPLGDRILVKRVESETKTRGGIIIPDTAKEKPQEGLVVATGPGAVREDGGRRELMVKSGDRILFGKYAGTEVKLDGVDHLILSESDVLGVLD
jgi:chaperonin GroES